MSQSINTPTFDYPCLLSGIVPRKGEGKLDNGQSWKTDRIDLHVQIPLDSNKGGIGFTTELYKLEGHDKHFSTVSNLVGKPVNLKLQMVNNGKGDTSVLVVGILPSHTNTQKIA